MYYETLKTKTMTTMIMIMIMTMMTSAEDYHQNAHSYYRMQESSLS